MRLRTEWDSLGAVEVMEPNLWGAQTQRALHHFDISTESMPHALIRSLALIKQCAAGANESLGLLDVHFAEAIKSAAGEVLEGQHDDQFPLSVWQSGSGTQTNMNMNEVLARRATQILSMHNADSPRVHPNDHVNLGQSSNDVFPTAMHVACATEVRRRLLPALSVLRATLQAKSRYYSNLIKIGRTHLQDAVPLTVGQELSAYESQIGHACLGIEHALEQVFELALGGTAVGTGLNTHPHFGQATVDLLSAATDLPFTVAANRFGGIAAHDALVGLHGALKTTAVALMKMANDLRWLASGPDCGLSEMILPANEPGSSIMPGKVNPSQCEAMMMVCCQVMGNDVAVGMAGASGNLQLNTFKPLLAHNVLQSIRLLTDASTSFHEHCVQGMNANVKRIEELRNRSLMLVTALAPHVGYDRASKIAQKAHSEGTSLREAAIEMGCEAGDFDRWVRLEQMV